MICFTSSLIRQLYHFATDLDRVLLQLVSTDIVNTLSKYTVSYKHQPFMTETSKLLLKSCEKFDPLLVNIQCATAWSLQKVNFKVKLLYLRYHISYFNKICRICYVNTRIQSVKVCTALFLRNCFFIGAPCTSGQIMTTTTPSTLSCQHTHSSTVMFVLHNPSFMQMHLFLFSAFTVCIPCLVVWPSNITETYYQSYHLTKFIV